MIAVQKFREMLLQFLECYDLRRLHRFYFDLLVHFIID